MYTQDQINTVVKSYLEEINRLLEVKANLHLQILKLRTENEGLKKENEELKKEK